MAVRVPLTLFPLRAIAIERRRETLKDKIHDVISLRPQPLARPDHRDYINRTGKLRRRITAFHPTPCQRKVKMSPGVRRCGLCAADGQDSTGGQSNGDRGSVDQ
jgi:hypothetical protein